MENEEKFVDAREFLAVDVVEFLNSEFSDDLTKLNNIQEVLDRIKNYEVELKNRVDPSNLGPSGILSFTVDAEEVLEHVSLLKESHGDLLASALEESEKMIRMRDNFIEKINKVKELENLHSYFQWLLKMENENARMEEALKNGASIEIIEVFSSIKQVHKKLKSSHCRHLVAYVQKTMFYWHDILKEKFGKEFQKVLTSLHWPILGTNISVPLNDSPEVIEKFNQLFIHLYQLQISDDWAKVKSENSRSLALLPLKLMIEPLEKRFLFHFMGKKPTNRRDKPEWYLTQILSWISDHSLFLDQTVQPFLDQKGFGHINARIELMQGLVQLAIARMTTDFPSLLVDDELLSHYIDEVLLFSQELLNQGYPKNYPNILQLLIEEPYFSRWRSLEHQSALEKMDMFLNSDSPWISRYQDEGDIDDLRVPECTELFVTLLSTMTERYCHLTDRDCQISFMELQLELLDDFRLRLHQLSQCEILETIQPNFCGILNAIHYIVAILEEWNNFPFFLQLHTYMKKKNAVQALLKENDLKHTQPRQRKPTKFERNSDEDIMAESVFDEIIALFEHIQKDLMTSLCNHVMLDIKAKSRAYRKERWSCLPVVRDKRSMDISTAAYPMLEVISSSLQTLQELLAKSLFTNVWQKVAMELNIYLYEEVILQNSFNEGGAMQLNYDMTRNLFPIFSSYTLRPDNYFKLVKESCILLNLKCAPSLLLKETLKDSEVSLNLHNSALEELGVYSLSPSQALVILCQRNDISL